MHDVFYSRGKNKKERAAFKMIMFMHGDIDLKYPRLRKQVVSLQNTALKFQILPRADRKGFLLGHQQTIDIQSCFTVPRYAFFIGFPITIRKRDIVN